MKKVMKSFATALLLGVFVLVSSCSGSDDNSNNQTTNDLFIKFKYNGVQYNYADPGTINSLSRSISAFEEVGNTSRSIVLFMPLEVTTGTFSITDSPSDVNSYSGYFSDGPTDMSFDGTSGTMVITSVTSEYVKGTFNFSAEIDGQIVEVTNGSFSAYK
jgi:hypothetical protein